MDRLRDPCVILTLRTYLFLCNTGILYELLSTTVPLKSVSEDPSFREGLYFRRDDSPDSPGVFSIVVVGFDNSSRGIRSQACEWNHAGRSCTW